MIVNIRINNALNDLSGQIFLKKNKAKVLTASKDAEDWLKCRSRLRNKVIKVKELLYVAINQQVTLQNQDPKRYGVYKSSLIDLEAYGVS